MRTLQQLVGASMAAVLTLALVATSTATAQAGLLSKVDARLKVKEASVNVLVKTTVVAKTAAVAKSASLADPTCCAPAPKPCCPEPCITYKHHCTLRRTCCDCCDPPRKIVLHVENPCTGCSYDIPVCLPGCCSGEPVVCERVGALGREVVTYEWCCGYRIKVIVDRCGDIVVHSFGR